MVTALKDRHALGSWEIINEPEGSIRTESDSNPCFSTSILAGSGIGWSEADIPMFRMLRFMNRQAAAIKRADPKALVTVGAVFERSTSDAFSNGCKCKA